MKSQSKILVVDDDPALRHMLCHHLKRAGFPVEECADGVEAFRLLEGLGGNALAVLDYEMPKFNGAQVCEIIRAHADPEVAQTPIIMLTGHSGEDQEIECLRAGADDFVTKPVNLPVLKVRIETHLRLASLRAQLQAQNRQLELWRAVHERDLEAARAIQQAIVPQDVPVLAGWEFAVRYQSLIQVGGDIYDWFTLPSGELTVWIADATGHGVSAALLTTFTKLLFHHAATESADPEGILRCVNRDFKSILEGHSFMTAACLTLRPFDGTVRLAGAGHPPVLVVRPDGRVTAYASTAPPVGLLELGHLEAKTAEVNRGDTMLLFTDGLYSVTDPQGEHYSLDKLVAGLLGRPVAGAEALIEAALLEVRRFAAGQPFSDDLAMVAMRRCE